MDVVNAGRNGMNAVNYLTRINSYRNDLSADLVIVGFSIGELSDIRESNLTISRNSEGQIQSVIIPLSQKDDLKRIANPVITNSALATYLMRRLKPVLVGLIEHSTDVYQSVFNWANADIASPGKKTNLPENEVIEVLEFVLTEISFRKPVLLVYFPKMNYGNDRIAQEANTDISEIYSQVARNAGVGYLNLATSFQQVYLDMGQPPQGFHNNQIGKGHLNILGHQEVGKALSQLIATFKTD